MRSKKIVVIKSKNLRFLLFLLLEEIRKLRN